jgi:uroporphyrinogen III methyltransferase/synthase
MKPFRTSQVYLIGAGPGDPGLITLRGVEALKKADVIVYDFLANEKLLAFAKPGAKTIYVGKKGRFRHIAQDEINRLMIDYAKKGKIVARLKGGDPFIFGRGAEEALSLRESGIPFEVIPGVTSAIAAPAHAGIPLTHRTLSSVVTFLTGQESPGKGLLLVDWAKVSNYDTLVFLMGWKNLEEITMHLVRNGRSPATPVAVIRWGTLPKQKTVVGTLENIAGLARKEAIKPPIVTVVGDVVGLREKLNWFETRPLFGRRILVTRAAGQTEEFTEILEGYGAETVSAPAIKIVPPRDYKPLDGAIRKLFAYDWALFTSVNGVRYFFERLYKKGYDVRELKGVKICAIGPATEKAVRERGLKVDLIPKEHRAEGVIEALGRKNIRNKRFLLPRAEVAREVLPEEIKKLGGKIDVVPVYRTVKPLKEAKDLARILSTVDIATFTSSSTVENFIGLFKKEDLKTLLKGKAIACIGPITARTVKRHGLKVDIMPKRYTLSALARAMAEYYRRR